MASRQSRIKVTSDGTTGNTIVKDTVTGAIVPNITSLKIDINPGKFPWVTGEMEIKRPEIEVEMIANVQSDTPMLILTKSGPERGDEYQISSVGVPIENRAFGDGISFGFADGTEVCVYVRRE